MMRVQCVREIQCKNSVTSVTIGEKRRVLEDLLNFQGTIERLPRGGDI